MAAQRILLIEDDAVIRETLQQVLELEGYSVLTAANGREGLARLENSPALILLDLMMPVMNGWEFMEELRRRECSETDPYCPPPVIVITAAGERINTLARPACTILRKPIDLDVLLEAILRYRKLGE